MKLLDWMHRKFRNCDSLKEFPTGNPCTCLMGQPSLDHIEYYPKSNYYVKQSSKTQHENQLRRSFANDEHIEEESSAAFSELFHGFLAIGTLGTDLITGDPATPTFSTSVEYIMEKETDATENELQFINDELEKAFSAEGKEDGCNDSSGRNSYVSVGRSSHGSTITLSGKVLEGVAESENGGGACPLQGYLFGSAIETTTGKKEHRTSLGELFQKTNMAEENQCTGVKCNRVQKQKEKESDKSAVHLMKKILKGRKGSGGTGTIDSASDKKLHKILNMFHRKVHPEGSTTTKSQNPSKYVRNGNFVEKGYKRKNQMLSGEDITIFPKTAASKKSVNNTRSYAPHATCGASDSNGNTECWIKSDANYLVLEL